MYAHKMRENELRIRQSCPFCRKPAPETEAEVERRNTKRAEANDPVALSNEGAKYYRNEDYRKALENFSKAAELGDASAHLYLARMYHKGLGVEEDEEKTLYHVEEAAIGGHPEARYALGDHEWDVNKNNERAVKHWIIAATQGDDDSIKALIDAFKRGHVSKETLVATLRAHKAAVDETESPQRKAADEYFRIMDLYGNI